MQKRWLVVELNYGRKIRPKLFNTRRERKFKKGSDANTTNSYLCAINSVLYWGPWFVVTGRHPCVTFASTCEQDLAFTFNLNKYINKIQGIITVIRVHCFTSSSNKNKKVCRTLSVY